MTKLYTIKEAAKQIGLEYRQLLQACSEQLVPVYRLRKSRRMVRIEDILSIMQKQGGGNV